MAQSGKNKGNRNAALPDGQMRAVRRTVSYSGERLNRFLAYLVREKGFTQDQLTPELVATEMAAFAEEQADKLPLS